MTTRDRAKVAFLRVFLGVFLGGSLVVTGCEDDPILEAPSGAASSGGSYGKLSIDSSAKTNVREKQLEEQRLNPVTF